MKIKFEHAVVVLIAVILMAVFAGASKMNTTNQSIYDGCKETDLVVIGNKGHLTKVYDCAGVEIK